MTKKTGVKYLTPHELAARWKMSATTLNQWRCDGVKFCKYYKIGNNVRYSLSDVEEYERERERGR